MLAEEEVNNARPIEFELPVDVRRMLQRHIGDRSPLLCPKGSPWLFPERSGDGHIDGNALSSRLSKRIRKEIGIEMNAHLFRHLAAMIWLNAFPGSELPHTVAVVGESVEAVFAAREALEVE